MNQNQATAAAARSGAADHAIAGARTALILLVLINLLNYIDRYILAGVLSKIKLDLLAGDPQANTKAGLLATAFMVAYMCLSPLFGVLGDRFHRWWLVGIGVLLWTAATGLCGLAWGYAILLIARCLVGVGEAAYGPVAPSIISELYPVRNRGKVLAIFYAAIPVGSALGYVLGGAIAGTWLGWRGAFLVAVIPGLILGALCFLMREPPRGQIDAVSSNARVPTWRDYGLLGKTRSYVLVTVGSTIATFVVGGVAVWIPAYVFEREAKFTVSVEQISTLTNGIDPVPVEVALKLTPPQAQDISLTYDQLSQYVKERLEPTEVSQYSGRIFSGLLSADSTSLELITVLFGVITVVAGLGATLIGGWLGDALRERFSGSYFFVSGATMMLSFPFFLGVLYTPLPWGWLFIFIAIFFLFANTGPMNTVLANVVHPSMRSSAFAINIFIIHALGDAISPTIIGGIADVYSLGFAFLLLSFLIPVSGAVWLVGIRYLREDTELAPHWLDSPPSANGSASQPTPTQSARPAQPAEPA
jgi:MFS family permease